MATRNSSSTRRIFKALGGDPDKPNSMCHCPAHIDEHPSFDVHDGKNGEPVFVCRSQHCSQKEIIEALTRKGLWAPAEREQDARIKKMTQEQLRRKHKEQEEQERKEQGWVRLILRTAAGAWTYDPAFGGSLKNPLPLPKRELVRKYLNSRGIDKVPDGAMEIPSHISKRLSEALSRRDCTWWPDKCPAMVCVVYHEGKLPTVHITRLAVDGSGKAPIAAPKKTYGSPDGGFIILGENEEKQPLLVAEGVETALAASQIAGLPALSGVSSGNLPKINADHLPGCSELISCPDENDDVGLL